MADQFRLTGGMTVVAMCLLTVAFGLPSAANAQGFSPEDAARRMKVPDGIEVNVFASEPEIRQPVASCWDHKGRLWVIEYLQYPVPEGLKPVTVDVYLRTEYDKVPEPPPKGPKGKDRIKILEDTDGDGKADKVTTFLEGLNLASAIAVGYDGVFIGQAPYLLYYSDKDHDDRPDGDPKVLLSGFGLQDAHAVVNSLAWGPDGWLYGAQGSTVTARIRGSEFQQGVWRYHFPTDRFELFAEGGGNTWGLDFDRNGQAFGSSNGAFITFHMTQGGYYWKGFSKHGPLHNPYAYGYFDAIAYDGTKKGGHVTPGGIIYRGKALPPAYQDSFIGGNLLSNTVYRHDLKPLGSTFKGKFGETLIESDDPWFRPIDLLTGPDDALYVVDWYDRRASHLDPRDNWDKTNGRIYRVALKNSPAAPNYDLTKETSAQLLDRLKQPGDFMARQAREELLFRADPATFDPLIGNVKDGTLSEEARLRSLWALGSLGPIDARLARDLLHDKSPAIREWTIRFLGNERVLNRALADTLEDLAFSEPSPAVRLQLAASCRRWPTGMMLPILAKLTERTDDLTDTMIPLTIWWTFQAHFLEQPEMLMGWLPGSAVLERPIVAQVLLPRVARMLVARGKAEDWDRLWSLYEKCPQPLKNAIEAEIEQGASAQAAAGLTGKWRNLMEVSAESGEPDSVIFRAALKFGNQAATRRTKEFVEDSARPVATRQALLKSLGAASDASIAPLMIRLIERDDTPQELLSEAFGLASGVNEPAIADAVLARYPNLSASAQAQAVTLLTRRPAWAKALLNAIEHGKIEKSRLTAQGAQAIDALGDPQLGELLVKVWGRPLRPTSEARVRRVAEIRGILPEGDKGVAARGRAVFLKVCSNCHQLFGDGSALGPELNGADRGNLDFLLTSLVDPSAQIRSEYQAVQVALKDGRVLQGLLADRNDAGITIVDAERKMTKLTNDEIEEIKVSESSLMPEGLLDPLKDDEIRDLFRYLQSPAPPPR
jgi:putative membrane-bound dehydrogenase-like protein